VNWSVLVHFKRAGVEIILMQQLAAVLHTPCLAHSYPRPTPSPQTTVSAQRICVNLRSSVWQWRSQKFSTGGASICSVPFCPFPYSCPTKSAVQSKNTHQITYQKIMYFPDRGGTPLVWLHHWRVATVGRRVDMSAPVQPVATPRDDRGR